jgi:hypothetical protein
MAEDEVRQLEDDGPYATKMREAIIGVRGQLADLNWLHAKMLSYLWATWRALITG